MSRAAVAARVIQGAAGLSAGAVAAFVIIDPSSDFAVAWVAVDEMWGGWARLFAVAPGLAVVTAALTVLALTRARQAWIVAAAAFAGVLLASGPVLELVIPQLAQRYSVVGLAGVALGAAAAALWPPGSTPGRGGVVCLVIGAAAGLLLSAPLAQVVAYHSIPRRMAEYIDSDFAVAPWWWAVAAAMVLALAAAVVGTESAVGSARDRRTLWAAVLVAVGGGASYVLADADISSLAVGIAALALALAACAVAAWLLPERDGRFLLAALAVSAVAASLVLELTAAASVTIVLDWPLLVAAAALIGVGGYLGARFPSPALGLTGLIVAAVLGATSVLDPSAQTVVRLLLAALAAAHLLASALPAHAASGAVGAAALFAPPRVVGAGGGGVRHGMVRLHPAL